MHSQMTAGMRVINRNNSIPIKTYETMWFNICDKQTKNITSGYNICLSLDNWNFLFVVLSDKWPCWLAWHAKHRSQPSSFYSSQIDWIHQLLPGHLASRCTWDRHWWVSAVLRTTKSTGITPMRHKNAAYGIVCEISPARSSTTTWSTTIVLWAMHLVYR